MLSGNQIQVKQYWKGMVCLASHATYLLHEKEFYIELIEREE